MKLSKKINIILLPVMLTIFSIAGFLSYSILKNQATNSILEQVDHETSDISNKLYATFNELDFFSQLLLDGENINHFLAGVKKSGDKYYFEKSLVDYIKNLKLTNGSLESFSLVDTKTGEVQFYTNLVDPFAYFNISTVLQKHLSCIDEKLKDQKVVQLTPKLYKFVTQNGQNKVILIRTFSPNQPISSTAFSRNYEMYTAMFIVNTDLIDEYSHHLQAIFGENVLFNVNSQGEKNELSVEHDAIVEKNTVSSKGYELINPLWSIEISIKGDYFNQIYSPYKSLFVGVVFFITIVTFLFLKWLITTRIISPIVRLTAKVESSDIEKDLNFGHHHGDDEVSILTNKYHDLIMELDELAKRDTLTNLANRIQYHADIKRYVKQSDELGLKCTVLYFDLDNFNDINEAYGHQTGDDILKAFSKVLINNFQDIDWGEADISEASFARVSADEFTVLFYGNVSSQDLMLFVQNIIALFVDGFKYEGNIYSIGVSVGIASYPDDATDAKSLMNCADLAMYEAKKVKGSAYQYYSKDLDLEIKRNKMIVVCLQDALLNQDFKLVFMPVFDCKSRAVCGAEALLRATSDDLVSIGPADFIPIAESSGMIKDIDYWVIEASLKTLACWIADFNFSGTLAINFSSWQLKNREFVPKVASLLKKYEIPPQQVELEITETCFVPGEYRNEQMLSELHQLGVKLSLDDFGTGFTAFSQLIDYPIDTLKVDRMFVSSIDFNDSGSAVLVDKIVEIAKLYDLNVIAEGVENSEQLEHITKIGCQQAQGFFLSKPISEEEFLQMLKG